MRKISLPKICLSIMVICLFTGTTMVSSQDYDSQGELRCFPPPAGMTGWWPGDGNTKDIIGGLNAVLRGGAKIGAGYVDQAFCLNGNGAFVEVANNPALNVGTMDFTIDLWVFFNDTAGEQILVEKWIQRWNEDEECGDKSKGWTWTKLEDNAIGFFTCDESIDECTGVTSCALPIPAKTWNHFAVTRREGVLTLFMNGEQVALMESNDNLNLDSNSSLKFGHRGTYIDTPCSEDDRGLFLNGRIDEVELFVGRALAKEEIQGIYKARRAGKCKWAYGGENNQ